MERRAANRYIHGTVVLALIVALGCERPIAGLGVQGPRLLPVDEAAQDAGLVRYLDNLRRAVRERNASVVLEAMSDELRGRFDHWLRLPRSTFGGQEQRDWQELETLLALGGSFTTTRGAVRGRREFCAPYVYSAFPYPQPEVPTKDFIPEEDPWVIVAAAVPVRNRPAASGSVLATLSYQLVFSDGGGQIADQDKAARTWASVVLADGRRGYVLDEQIRTNDAYHACFARVDDRWQMVRFAQGIRPAPTAR